jgi:hypothetical protein
MSIWSHADSEQQFIRKNLKVSSKSADSALLIVLHLVTFHSEVLNYFWGMGYDAGADEEKENNFEAMFPPLSSVVGSPPLSARLKNLCQRMRALSPLPSNLSRLPEHEETACHSKCKTLSNFSTPNQVATCASSSPLQLSEGVPSHTITPSQSVSLFDSVCHTGTPFERFSKGNPTLQVTF